MTSLVRMERRRRFFPVTEFIASASIIPLSPPTPRQTSPFFRTDAVKAAESPLWLAATPQVSRLKVPNTFRCLEITVPQVESLKKVLIFS